MKLTKWAIFTVIFSLGPLLANVFATGDKPYVELSDIIGRGELFVIAAAVTADGLARIWTEEAVKDILGTVIFGSLAFLLLATCTEFGWISNDLRTAHVIAQNHMTNSLVIFACSVVAGFSAVLMEIL